jgi:hypothetical protein
MLYFTSVHLISSGLSSLPAQTNNILYDVRRTPETVRNSTANAHRLARVYARTRCVAQMNHFDV